MLAGEPTILTAADRPTVSARAPRPSAAALAVALIAATVGTSATGHAQGSNAAPAADIPTVTGTQDATIPPPESGGAAGPPVTTTTMPPAVSGTLSSWRSSSDRSAIRIGSELGADELLNAEIIDPTGQTVGRIDDLLIDSDGLVRKAVLKPADGASETRIVDLIELRRWGEGRKLVWAPSTAGQGATAPATKP